METPQHGWETAVMSFTKHMHMNNGQYWGDNMRNQCVVLWSRLLLSCTFEAWPDCVVSITQSTAKCQTTCKGNSGLAYPDLVWELPKCLLATSLNLNQAGTENRTRCKALLNMGKQNNRAESALKMVTELRNELWSYDFNLEEMKLEVWTSNYCQNSTLCSRNGKVLFQHTSCIGDQTGLC